MPRTPKLLTVSAICTALALAACTEDEPDPVDAELEMGLEATEADEQRLIAALTDAEDVRYEIDTVVARLMRDCMDELGFTVHDETEFLVLPTASDDEVLNFMAPVDHIPTAEEAAETGFMVWAETYEGRGDKPEEESNENANDYYEAMDGPFFDLPDDERERWERAFRGDEEYDWRRSEDAEKELERPAPGGCYGEVHEAVYGEPTRVSDEEIEMVDWQWGEPSPLFEAMDPAADLRVYRDQTRDEEMAFLTCLDEGGNSGWEFGAEGYIDPFTYLHALYNPDPANAGIEFDEQPAEELEAMPDIPADAPYDYDKAFGIEVDLAVDFAACADETGYREAGQTQWRGIQIGRILAHETEVYAWQEQMETYLTKAQDLLEA